MTSLQNHLQQLNGNNNKMKKLLSTFFLSLAAAAVMAVPAKKGLWKTITLENGKEVNAQLMGDEFGHYWRTANGQNYYAVEGRYKEATPAVLQMAAQHRAKATQLRTARAKRHQTRGAFSPSTIYQGDKKGLIILVNFSDVKFQDNNDQAFYTKMANTSGFSERNFTGSVADYFKDQSRGQFVLTFDVVGPVTVSKEASYYGQNDENGNDMYAEEMVAEAVNLAKEHVTDWKQYDWDNDGEVDQVMIIYAGEGEADGGAEDTIWPHEYCLSYLGSAVDVSDGLKVNTYAVANEGFFSNGEFYVCGIGTVCHEFSHCLGLPDMYDVSYSGNYGMQSWSLMDNGSYNNSGFTPPCYTSFEKLSIGWITPTELTETQSVSAMRALNDSDDVYMIRNAAHTDEFYLLENRQQKGWDTYVPANGMLILHVDYDENLWHYNLVNSYSDGTDDYPVNDHQRCTIFHADGADSTGLLYNKMNEVLNDYYNAIGSEADNYLNEYWTLYDLYDAEMQNDVYPQPGNNQLTNTSVPRAFLYNKNTDGRKLMNISITDITQNTDGTIAFKFAVDNSGSEEGDNTDYGNSNQGGSEAAIRTIETSTQKDGRTYTLQGRQVNSDSQELRRGIYIVNGKKVVK